jgi:hypothetical protein
MKSDKQIKNVVVVSDIHAGSALGLCPPEGAPLDDGGVYKPSKAQLTMWSWWEEFWGEWVPWAVEGEPYCVVFNGDALDGVHHGTTTLISANLGDQAEIAHQILEPIVAKCDGKYWHIRGTEAHVGQSAAEEERLAKRLGAVRSPEGHYARWELWKQLGDACLIHFLHHIGTTSSNAYEGTAVHKELVESFVEAARWGHQPPDFIIRSHRHRHFETKVMTGRGRASAVVTPGWQLKTPFTFKIAGARLSQPQCGGIVIRRNKDVHYAIEKVWSLSRPAVE